MAGQVIDTVILHPVQPASGLSACPGQDVKFNCTIVRVTNIPGVVPPPLQWQYRGDQIIYNNPMHTSVYYATVSHVVGLTVMSNATINGVQISDQNRMITCQSLSAINTTKITIAGKSLTFVIIIIVRKVFTKLL